MEEEMGLKSAHIILDDQGPSRGGWKVPKDHLEVDGRYPRTIQRALEDALELSVQ